MHEVAQWYNIVIKEENLASCFYNCSGTGLETRLQDGNYESMGLEVQEMLPNNSSEHLNFGVCLRKLKISLFV